jgi:cytochrome c biogenesis protein CcmG, thiol:disulfide interchange protein DsbE
MITQERGQTPSAPRGAGAWLSRFLRPGRLSRAGKLAYWSGAVALLVAAGLVLTVAAAPGKKAALPKKALPPPLAKSFSLAELGHPGATVSLAAYAGRPVIVNFFASWCAPCQQETPMLARYYASQHGRVVLLGIDANDETTAALRFVAKAGVSYPVGFDRFPSPVTTSYGVYALPQTFFLDAQHRIVAKVMGAVTQKELSTDVALMNRERG